MIFRYLRALSDISQKAEMIEAALRSAGVLEAMEYSEHDDDNYGDRWVTRGCCGVNVWVIGGGRLPEEITPENLKLSFEITHEIGESFDLQYRPADGTWKLRNDHIVNESELTTKNRKRIRAFHKLGSVLKALDWESDNAAAAQEAVSLIAGFYAKLPAAKAEAA